MGQSPFNGNLIGIDSINTGPGAQAVPGLTTQAQALYDKIYRVPDSAPKNIKDRAQIGLILFDIIFSNHPNYFNVLAETMNDTVDALTPCLAFNRGGCRILAALHSQTRTKNGELHQAITHICEYCYYGRWTAGIHKATNCDLRPLLHAHPAYTSFMGATAPPTITSRLTINSANTINHLSNANVQTIPSHESPDQRASVPPPNGPGDISSANGAEGLSLTSEPTPAGTDVDMDLASAGN